MSDLNPYEEGLAYDLGRAQARIKELEQAERQTYRDALELAKQIDALTELLATTNEQLAAARKDAEEAEAYAEELEAAMIQMRDDKTGFRHAVHFRRFITAAIKGNDQ